MNNQSIKDFNVGEKAYVVYANIGYNSPPRMKEVIITKVGRKYVTVKGLESYSSEYCYDDDSNVFRPKENYDISTLLYSSKNSAEEEIKRLQLKPKISTIIQYKIGSFSTEDIKAIYEIVKKYENKSYWRAKKCERYYSEVKASKRINGFTVVFIYGKSDKYVL